MDFEKYLNEIKLSIPNLNANTPKEQLITLFFKFIIAMLSFKGLPESDVNDLNEIRNHIKKWRMGPAAYYFLDAVEGKRDFDSKVAYRFIQGFLDWFYFREYIYYRGISRDVSRLGDNLDTYMKITHLLLDELHGIDKIIAFGSRATGKYTAESDYDICVIVDSSVEDFKNLRLKYHNYLSNKYEHEIDIHIYNKSDFDNRNFYLISSLYHEGVIIYG